MSLESLISAKKKTVGTKQTLKALEKGQARKVFIATDADRFVTEPVCELCRKKGVPIVEVSSMKELGQACGIEVNCATASIIEE